MKLGNFDTAEFLDHAWQQKPLLIRNAWDEWRNPLEPDELAGLACEPGVESRLITQNRGQWTLENGPLPEHRFAELGAVPWTLLVQAVDHHVRAVAELLERFSFIPRWRVDDVMVSYAVDGGGVGPHFDQYDVFLVQGLGQRRWQIGGRCEASAALLPHGELRLLASFGATDEWVLEPGDMLYVPPGFAHNGVAVGDDCMTYSVGFRAPSRSELLAGWTETLMGELAEDDRYGDGGLAVQDNPGEIGPAAIAMLHQMITERINDREAFARWFGTYSTTPKSHEIDWCPEQPIGPNEVRSAVCGGIPLLRNPASRFAFVRRGAGHLTLFVDGSSHDCCGPAGALAERLCAGLEVTIEPDLLACKEGVDLIVELANSGSVAFSAPDDQ